MVLNIFSSSSTGNTYNLSSINALSRIHCSFWLAAVQKEINYLSENKI